MFPVNNPYQFQSAMVRLWSYNLAAQMRVFSTLSKLGDTVEVPEAMTVPTKASAPAGTSAAARSTGKKRTHKPSRPPEMPGKTAEKGGAEQRTDNVPV